MERQAGLGRSLREVIESLTPVEPEMAARVQFDATELIERLDELLVDVRDLRERVHQLALFVGDETGAAGGSAKKKKKKKKHKGKKQHETVEGP
jgi:hypothetical protein